MVWEQKKNYEILELKDFELKVHKTALGVFYLVLKEKGRNDCIMFQLKAKETKKAKVEAITEFLDWINADLEKKKAAMFEVLKVLK